MMYQIEHFRHRRVAALALTLMTTALVLVSLLISAI